MSPSKTVRPNPYAPPPVIKPGAKRTGRRVLASRGSRLMAQIIDASIPIPVYIIAVVLFFLGEVGFIIGLTLLSVFGIAYTAIQCIWLATKSATIGKRMMGIYIADHETGAPSDAMQALVMRLIVWGVIAAIIGIIDVLFIFREDQRCLHDLFAKTDVLQR